MDPPTTFLTFSLSSTSPLLAYTPPEAWRSDFSNTPNNLWEPGMLGGGISAHTSNIKGATVFFEYPGTRVELQGQISGASSSPLTFAIDGESRIPVFTEGVNGVSGWSAGSGNRSAGLHNTSVRADEGNTGPGFIMSLRSIKTEVGVVAESTDPAHLDCISTLLADDMQSSAPTRSVLHITSWRSSQTLSGAGGQRPIKYSFIVANQTGVIKFFPPKSANFFLLNGTVGWAYGSYSVHVDPPAPFQRTVNIFNASSRWTKPGEVMYYTPLDPGYKYTITVCGDAYGGKELALHSWGYCLYAAVKNTINDNGTVVNPPTEGKSTNVGAIAGGVFGSVLGAIVLGVLLVLFIRRQRVCDDPDGMFRVDNTVDATMPYPSEPKPPPTPTSTSPTSPTSPVFGSSTKRPERSMSMNSDVGDVRSVFASYGSEHGHFSPGHSLHGHGLGFGFVPMGTGMEQTHGLIKEEDAGDLPMPTAGHLPPSFKPHLA